MSGPTVGASDQQRSKWEAHPRAAAAVRLLVVLVPLAASFLAAWSIRSVLPRPDNPTATVIFVLAIAITAAATAAAVERLSRRLMPLASLLELSLVFPDQAPSRYSTALRAGTIRQLTKQIDDVKANQFSSDPTTGPQQILTMVEALKQHEPLTRGHSERVRAYSALIAEEMGLSEEARGKLQWAVLVHDIGKLAVPAELLNKDGRPTEDEWEVIKRHPEIGAQMVAPLATWLGDFVHAAGQHHEKWDGAGYPTGLAGEQISLAGRIVAVADAYDVITSTRSYKRPMSQEAARTELVDSAGSHFDPAVVKAMLQASVGKIGGRSGRFAWLGHLDALIQPGAVASGIGATAVGSAMAAVAIVATPPEEPRPSLPDAVAFADEDELRTQLPATNETEAGTALSESNGASLSSRTVDNSTDAPTTAGEAGDPLPLESSSVPTSTTTTNLGPPANNDNSATSDTASSPGSTTATSSRVKATVSTSTPTSSVGTTATTTTAIASTTSTSGFVSTTTTTLTTCQQLQSGTGTDASGADLRECDLSGRSLFEVNLAGANLANVNLTGTTINHFNLDGANLSGATLTNSEWADGSALGADLSDIAGERMAVSRVNMAYTNLTSADLSGAVIEDTSFGFATLIGAQLDGAELSGVNFNDADASSATFAGASAIGTEFWRTFLTGANVASTNIDGAVFGRSKLYGATGNPANASRATYIEATCPDGIVSNSPCW